MPGARATFIWTGVTVLFIVSLAVLFFPTIFEVKYSVASLPLGELPAVQDEVYIPVTHLPTPEPLKAIYMTSCVAGTPSWREQLKSLIETSELNGVVIDIKDYTGRVAFPNNFPKSILERGCGVSDLKEFVAALHQSRIYVIGRISVFQDLSYSTLFPELAVKSLSTGGVWQDYKGLSFIDVGAKPYWEYILDISNTAYELGFDELNYDYVRYPSDGNMEDTNYTWTHSTSSGQVAASSTRTEMLQSFFSYLHENLLDVGVKTSVDLFGMTTTATHDLGIGQVLELALPYFDYVSPMVYPSHYPPTWNGFENPAEHPYDVVRLAISEGKRREEVLNILLGIATSTPSKLRPWLQDFNLGATYGPDKVRAQIQATYDIGLTSWMLWNAGNKYTEAALLPD